MSLINFKLLTFAYLKGIDQWEKRWAEIGIIRQVSRYSRWDFQKYLCRPPPVRVLKLLTAQRTLFLGNCLQTRHKYRAETKFSHNMYSVHWIETQVLEIFAANREDSEIPLSIINLFKQRDNFRLYLDCRQKINRVVWINWPRGMQVSRIFFDTSRYRITLLF